MADEKSAADRFLDQVEADPNLRDAMQKVTDGYEELGKEHGFIFTRDEFYKAVRTRLELPKPPDNAPDLCLTIPVPPT